MDRVEGACGRGRPNKVIVHVIRSDTRNVNIVNVNDVAFLELNREFILLTLDVTNTIHWRGNVDVDG